MKVLKLHPKALSKLIGKDNGEKGYSDKINMVDDKL